ncbi:hypothetical protein [Bernardetia sp.]|uniref:hypothetical protein n=1 Tax=Bernardetia sp. TaxID=1937974 RepID=UPI0025BE1992|nr:hypothetical protein [Bernardetia sp.]
MILFLVKLRFKQLFRVLSEFGLVRGIILLLLVGVGIGYFYEKFFVLESYQIELIFLALIFSLHQNRNDYHFLSYLSKNQTKNSGFRIRTVEYTSLFFLFHFPLFFVLEISWHQLIYFFISFILSVFLAFYSPKNVKSIHFALFFKKIILLIPLSVWEWRMTLRKNTVFFLLYILGCIICVFWAALPYILLFYALFLTEIYNHLEPKELIQSYQTKQKFWNNRLSSAFLFGNLIFLPHYVITFLNLLGIKFIFFDISYSTANFPPLVFLGILAGCFILYNLILFQLIVYKYSSLDNQNGKTLNMFPITIFILISIFLPVSLFIFYQTWKKANRKVALLLN